MIHSFLTLLAQTTAPLTQPATQAASQAATQAASRAAGSQATTETTSTRAQELVQSFWDVNWHSWFSFHDTDRAISAATTLIVFSLAYLVLVRIFRKHIEYYKLSRATAWGAVATIIYVTIWVGHIKLMGENKDIVAVTLHKLYFGIMAVVAIRFVDRLIVVPLLTRISGGPPSRFIHQIVVTITSMIVIGIYLSTAFGIELGPLLTGSAVISIVLGLALQETLGNFFSGMVLQASVPFQPGDWVQIGDIEGRVVEMTWRNVTIITGANNYVLIPNSTVAKDKIVNFHSPTVATAANVVVGLDYSIPPNDAKRVLLQAAVDTPGVLTTPAPAVALSSFDDSAITYKVIFWIDDPKTHGAVEQSVRVNIWYRVNQAGYNIPFPIRTVEFTDMEKKQAVSRQQTQDARLAVIRKSPIFSEIAPDLQQKLAAETREFALAAGQTFFWQNDTATSLYILTEGTVAISHTTGEGKTIHVTDLTAPAILGELSAVTGQPRSATYRAKTDCRAIEVDRDHLQDLFTHDPNFATRMSEIVAERQKQRDALMKQAGASPSASHDHAHQEPHNVLDRMKRLFSFGHR